MLPQIALLVDLRIFSIPFEVLSLMSVTGVQDNSNPFSLFILLQFHVNMIEFTSNFCTGDLDD